MADYKCLVTSRNGDKISIALLANYENAIISQAYSYQVLKALDYSEITKGGVQSLITQTDLSNMNIVIPLREILVQYEVQTSTIFYQVDNKKKENEKLIELQSLLLAKMGQLK